MTSAKTSKKLVALPVAVKGGMSSVPGELLTISSILPRVGRAGSKVTCTEPIELMPFRFNCVISVCTSSKPFPSLSDAWPLGGIYTLTVVGPLKGTVSVWPLRYCSVSSAAELGMESTSTGRVLTITVKVQLVTCPQELLAVHVTVFVPRAKQVPLGGLHTNVGGGVQPPLAVLV